MNFVSFIFIGIGGFIGAVLRAYVYFNLNNKTILGFSLATLLVNLLGSFIMGVLFAYFYFNTNINADIKKLLTTGLLGAFTTYSTFAIETVVLLQAGNVLYALLSALFNVLGCVACAYLGVFLVKMAF